MVNPGKALPRRPNGFGTPQVASRPVKHSRGLRTPQVAPRPVKHRARVRPPRPELAESGRHAPKWHVRLDASSVLAKGPREVCNLACRCLGPREVSNLAAGADKQSQAATPLIGIVRPPRPEVADSGRFTQCI